jgi:hypothetical protein
MDKYYAVCKMITEDNEEVIDYFPLNCRYQNKLPTYPMTVVASQVSILNPTSTCVYTNFCEFLGVIKSELIGK